MQPLEQRLGAGGVHCIQHGVAGWPARFASLPSNSLSLKPIVLQLLEHAAHPLLGARVAPVPPAGLGAAARARAAAAGALPGRTTLPGLSDSLVPIPWPAGACGVSFEGWEPCCKGRHCGAAADRRQWPACQCSLLVQLVRQCGGDGRARRQQLWTAPARRPLERPAASAQR